MISAIELERYIAGAGILSIIVGKLCYGKKLYPIILLEVDKSLEISFHRIILLLNLAVHLQVEGNGKFPLDAKEIV